MSTLFPAPTPASEQTPKRPKIIIWKWTLVATALFFAYLMWECGSGLYQGGVQANGAVRHFHQELNDGQYEQICQEAETGFCETTKHDEVTSFLQGVHKKLGNATAESLIGMNVNANTNGTFITTRYNSTFADGSAEETFTWVKSSGKLKLHGYNIQSNAFILK
jgi:hypothetical protein